MFLEALRSFTTNESFVSMLRPQYTRRPFELLLIGPPHSGKNTLATQLLKTTDVFYSINTADDVPSVELKRIDYVLILVDLTQAYSLPLLNTILQRLTPEYIMKKVAIVATKVDLPRLWQIEKHDVDIMVNAYFDLPIFFVNLMNEVERKRTCDQISNLIKLTTLQYKKVSIPLTRSLNIRKFEDVVMQEEDSTGQVQQQQ